MPRDKKSGEPTRGTTAGSADTYNCESPTKNHTHANGIYNGSHSHHAAKEGEPMVANRKPAEQRRLEAGVRDLTGETPEGLGPTDWTSLCEQFSLQVLYPGEHVAFRDHYEGSEKERRLVQREVICHSRNLLAVQKKLDALGPDEQAGVVMHYVQPTQGQRTSR
jgi:hypothetical protein